MSQAPVSVIPSALPPVVWRSQSWRKQTWQEGYKVTEALSVMTGLGPPRNRERQDTNELKPSILHKSYF